MRFLGRWLAALIILGAIPFHAMVPSLQALSVLNERWFEMLAGADPLVTSYLDAGLWPSFLLAAATLCLIGGLAGVLKGERWAASLVFLTAVADAVSLYLVERLSLTDLPLSTLQIVGLGAAMVGLFLLVRAVTKPV